MPAAEEALAAGALMAPVAEVRDEVPLSVAEGVGEVDKVLLVSVPFVPVGDEDTVGVEIGVEIEVPPNVVDVAPLVELLCAETATTAAAARRAVVKRIVFWLFVCFGGSFRKRLWWCGGKW